MAVTVRLDRAAPAGGLVVGVSTIAGSAGAVQAALVGLLLDAAAPGLRPALGRGGQGKNEDDGT